MRPELRDQLGAALNSRSAIMLYGPPGAGKTYLCEQMARLLTGHIAVPHAVEVGGEIIRLYDPLVHRPPARRKARFSRSTTASASMRAGAVRAPGRRDRRRADARMLDLVFDPRAGYYQAPPHFKANNGLFLVDDLGRQLITPRQLLNRWLLPMEQRHDYLMLRNGAKFRIPFDTQLFFSTNLRLTRWPTTPSCGASATRSTSARSSSTTTGGSCARRAMATRCSTPTPRSSTRAALPRRLGQPLLACYPRDLVSQIADYAAYLGQAPELSVAMLDWAWHNYFASHGIDGPRAMHGLRTLETTS